MSDRYPKTSRLGQNSWETIGKDSTFTGVMI